MSKQRIFNMHPTQAFLGMWNGSTIIHQPQKGEWAERQRKVPNPASPRKWSMVHELVCVDPNKVCRNWIDVEPTYIKTVTQDGLGSGRLQPSFKPNVEDPEAKEVDHLHHGGFLKSQETMDVYLANELKERLDKLAALEQQLLEKQKVLASVQEDVAEATRGKRRAAGGDLKV